MSVIKKGAIANSGGGGSGGDRYRGAWNASTNTPTLPNPPTSPSYQAGDYYQVIVAGTQFGIDFTVGDEAVVVIDGSGLAWDKREGGIGTVTTVSVASANGFAGSVTNPTTTPEITLSTTVIGILKGDGTEISAATPGTDYFAPGENLDLEQYSLIAGSVYIKAGDSEDTSVTLHALLSDDTQIASVEFKEDGSSNFSGIALSPNFVSGAAKTESVDSQTLLTLDSPFNQEFFGTDFQIVKLPDATTLENGHPFLFINNSTGDLDIRTTNNEQIAVITEGARQLYQLSDNSTSSGVWNVSTYLPDNVVWGENIANIPTGAINLTNSISNTINFGTNGVGAPTMETRSSGTKEVYYNSLSISSVDYARGVASGELWDSVPTNGKHKFYCGTEAVAEFSNVGSFVYSTFYVSDSFSTGRLGVSQLAATDENRVLTTLTTDIYPDLTEISYIKGAESNIQDQIDAISGDLGNLVPYTGADAPVDLGVYGLTATGLSSTDGRFVSVINTGTFYTPTAPDSEVGFTFQNASTVYSQLVCNQYSDPGVPGTTQFRFFAPKNSEGASIVGTAVSLVAGVFAGESFGIQTYTLDSNSRPSFASSLIDGANVHRKFLSANFIDATNVRLSVPYLTASRLVATDADNNLVSISSSSLGFVPYEGADQDVDLGSYRLLTAGVNTQELTTQGNVRLNHLQASKLVGTDADKNLINYNLIAGENVAIDQDGIDITISCIPPANIPFTTVTGTSQSISMNNGYIARSSTSVNFTLPTTAAIGEVFEILYRSPNPGQLLQNAGQTIIAGNQQTAVGTSGRIEGINNGEVLVIRCTDTDTEFMVVSPVGNFNVV